MELWWRKREREKETKKREKKKKERKQDKKLVLFSWLYASPSL